MNPDIDRNIVKRVAKELSDAKIAGNEERLYTLRREHLRFDGFSV